MACAAPFHFFSQTLGPTRSGEAEAYRGVTLFHSGNCAATLGFALASPVLMSVAGRTFDAANRPVAIREPDKRAL